MKTERASEIFKKVGLAKMVNTKVIKYGKITENLVYELTQDISREDECMLSFVEKTENDYLYNSDDCVYGTMAELIQYIQKCKEEKRIIKK
mgnify:FL=1